MSGGGRGGGAARTVGLALLLAALVILSYGPAYRAGFVWDDETILLSEPIRAADGLGRIWTEPRALENEDHYWPLVYTTFWLEHAMWGFAPRGYHVTNVLLHLAGCLLLWRILRRLRVPGAWLGAALWSVHPVHVESVAWVIERKDVLATACALGATLAWLRSRDAGSRAGGSTPAYAAALVLFCAGLLSKTSVVTLPFALAVVVWWRHGTLRRAEARAELRSLAPFAVLAAAAAAADLAYVRAGPSSSFDLSALDRILIASRAVWFYLGKLAWPYPLPVIYPRWTIAASSPGAWLAPAALLALAAWLAARARRGARGPLAALLLFGLLLAPTLGLVDFGYLEYAFVADRFQHLASVAPLALLAAGAAGLAGGAGDRRRGLGVVAVVVLAALSGLTWRQAARYESPEVFFRHIVAHNPDAHNAWYNLGTALVRDPARTAEAAACFREGVARQPDSVRLRVNLGSALLNLERPGEAVEHLAEAVRLEPGSVMAHGLLAVALFGLERPDEAEEHFRLALAADPDDLTLRGNYAFFLLRSGRPAEAREQYAAMLARDPDHAQARAGLAACDRADERGAAP